MYVYEPVTAKAAIRMVPHGVKHFPCAFCGGRSAYEVTLTGPGKVALPPFDACGACVKTLEEGNK